MPSFWEARDLPHETSAFSIVYYANMMKMVASFIWKYI